MNTPVSINPLVITTSRTATSFSIKCMSLDLFKTASFVVTLFDEKNSVVKTEIVKLTSEQYNEWKNDDTYITNLISNMLGIKPAS